MNVCMRVDLRESAPLSLGREKKKKVTSLASLVHIGKKFRTSSVQGAFFRWVLAESAPWRTQMSSSWFVFLVVCGGDRKDEHETNALEIENDFEVDSRPRAAKVGRAAGSK